MVDESHMEAMKRELSRMTLAWGRICWNGADGVVTCSRFDVRSGREGIVSKAQGTLRQHATGHYRNIWPSLGCLPFRVRQVALLRTALRGRGGTAWMADQKTPLSSGLRKSWTEFRLQEHVHPRSKVLCGRPFDCGDMVHSESTHGCKTDWIATIAAARS